MDTSKQNQESQKRRPNMAKQMLIQKKAGFGTPSYPSPLDTIREGRSKVTRAEQMGLAVQNKASFELNQSFPKVAKSGIKSDILLDVIKTPQLQQFDCEGMNDVSFSPGFSKGSFFINKDTLDQSLDESWSFYNYVGGGHTGVVFPQAVRNPNKAICTINAKTSEILIANEMACDLFGFDKSDLIGRNLKEMIQLKSLDQKFISESYLQFDGELVDVSGKVFDVTDSDGIKIPVSLWMKKLDIRQESSTSDKPVQKCLVVMEPVKRSVAILTFTSEGKIVSCNKQTPVLYGYKHREEVVGKTLRDLIPAVVYPTDGKLTKDVANQTATGKTKDGNSFPLSIQVGSVKDLSDFQPNTLAGLSKEEKRNLFQGTIWVFSNISGMICINDDGKIHNVNEALARLLFGFEKTNLIGKDISVLIPDFYEILDEPEDKDEDDGIALPPVDDDEIIFLPHPSEGKDCNKETPTFGHVKNKLQHFDEALVKTSTPKNPDSTLESISSRSETECINISSEKEPETPNVISVSSDSFTSSSVKEEESLDEGIKADVSGNAEPSTTFVVKTKNLTRNLASLNRVRHKMLDRLDDSSSSKDIPRKDIPSFLSDSKLAIYVPSCSRKELIVSNKNNNCSHGDDNDNGDELLNTDTQIEEESSYFSHDSNISVSALSPINLDTKDKEIPTTPVRRHVLDRLTRTERQGLSYSGAGRHADGCYIGVTFQMKRVELGDGRHIFCMWISRDPQEPEEGGRSHACLTLASSFNTTLNQSTTAHSLAEASLCVEQCLGNIGRMVTEEVGMDSRSEPDIKQTGKEDLPLVSGEYSKHYTTLSSIGKGAFGYVKLAERLSDKEQVVVKFVLKMKLYPDSFVLDRELGKIPLEISLLRKLSHPNIIEMVDFYENDKVFQIVMKKHGSGMDLFEFIDRCPVMDEALVSYLFRQMVDAVIYLNANNIVHRDLKDENMILDENFHVKLIDFGAAAYILRGCLFSTFCGTLEFCSPEIIEGNKYRGPELEIWALGITLYTLAFGDNPFYNVDETLVGALCPPRQLSPGLMKVIYWTLDVDPNKRATIQDLEEDSWVYQEVDITNYSWEQVLPNCEFTGNTASDNRGEYIDEEEEEDDEEKCVHSPSKHLQLDDKNTSDST